MQNLRIGGLAILILLAVACGAPRTPATPATATPTRVSAPADSGAGFLTPEGHYALGRSDAPNVIVMYSDVF